MDDRDKQLLALGREHYELREFEQAERYLVQLVERGCDYADVHNMLGVIRHDGGLFDEARASFERALEVNPGYTEASLNLAVTYNDLGRFEDAQGIYDQARARGGTGGFDDPFVRGRIANLHAAVADAYIDAQHPGPAITELRTAVSLCPTFADLRLKLAQLLRETGAHEDAKTELETTIELKPSYVPAHVALGSLLLLMSDKEAARKSWNAALAIDPECQAAKMYLRMTKPKAATK